eukprot:CAMPEP_0168335966 /NCGR_PEP_ID=MMETSP0213-20121227/11244_1 /TAXON_ID=151035 /ORGANISM="Euplotes harpa, Strain FSP1.4" /LENGTH=41 /DNA_ID= /DNA_START= /DNA_END= /DNA_ORIENTATION=
MTKMSIAVFAHNFDSGHAVGVVSDFFNTSIFIEESRPASST